MNRLARVYRSLSGLLDRAVSPLLPGVARLVFAGVLLAYFWASAVTKLGPGPFGIFFPSSGGFVQIYPRAMEAVSYDSSQLGILPHLVVVAGLLAEFLLPLLIIVGFLTRLAALGMIGFVAVQTATDIFGHGAETGAWFDRASDHLIADQRALWVVLLLVLVAKGAGALSLDRALLRA